MTRSRAFLVGLALGVAASGIAGAADGASDARSITGKVIGVIDGDTLTVLVDREQVRVRLAEIDAPERGQPWSKRSTQALSEKVFGKVVELRPVDTDKYGRTVAHVYLGDRQISRELVREGHAWVYRRFLRDESLLEDEAAAREEGAGLWGLPEAHAAPPWEWYRHGWERQEARPSSEPDTSCGSKRYCREMVSCEEAYHYLKVCGLTRLDGDGDGIPCEALCR